MKPLRHTQEMMERYTRGGYWCRPSIPDLWDYNARNYPDKEAIVDSKTRMTWSEAKKWIDRVALGLLELGIKKDEVIVSQLPNSVEAMLIRYSLEKAGILGLPVMMTLRQREIEYILSHVKATGIILVPEFGGFNYYHMIQEIRPNLPQLRYLFVLGDQVPEGTISIKQLGQHPIEERYPDDYLQSTKFGPYELIGLMMTSGTTGFPKFVERPNNLWLTGKVNVERWKMTGEDICAAFAPIIGGGSGVLCWLTAPHVAAKVVILEKFDPEEALRLIEKERVTIASGVPAQMAMIVRHPNFDYYDLSSLRAFFYAGAVCPYSLAEEVEAKMGCRIITDLGAADCSQISSTSIDDPPEIRRTSVGKPYPGVEVKLLDEEGKEVPAGEIGEIVVRGAVATAGYFRDPESTSQVWGTEPDGWFHMGDLGKFDDQGNLLVVGRKKDMIIRGGQNIIPGEIENMLIAHPKILNVAIVAMPDPVMGEKACAYVIPKPGQELTFDEMIAFLKEKKIASYKLPERLEIVDSFPMSGDGQKIIKRALSDDIARKLRAEGEKKEGRIKGG
jgi:non-ribosomal peptide synthetase component E (peptide arylation enzyme)